MTTTPRQSPTDHTSPADLLGPKEVLEIQEQGRAAFHTGHPVTDCPWKAAQTPADRARCRMWINGYAQGRTELRQAREPQPD